MIDYINYKEYKKKGKDVNLKNNCIFSFDIETNGLDAREFKFGVISWNCNNKNYNKIFKDYRDMKNFIKEISLKAKEKKIKVWFYAHNLQYDYYGIFKDNYFEEGVKYICFYPFMVEYNEYCILVDNMAIYPMALKKVGDICNLKKLDIDKGFVEGNKEEITNEDIKYCIRDCQIILEGLKYYKETIKEIFGVGIKKMMTTPQITIKLFQTFKRVIDNEERLFNLKGEIEYNKKYKDFMMLSYRGARVQAFKKGKFEGVTQLDINSLYPYIMKKMRFPTFEYSSYYTNVDVEKFKEEYMQYQGVIKCDIIIPKLKYGYLPVLYKKYQLFVNNECQVNGTWTIFEIRNALKLGYEIVNIDEVLIFEKGYIRHFGDYIDKLYDIKKNNERLKPIAKLLMNSLYGKFGQVNDLFDLKHIKVKDIYDYPDYIEKGRIGEDCIIEKQLGKEVPKWNMPYISSIITAMARDYLFKFINEIDEEDLLYCDTDSIVLLNYEKYKDKFNISDEIGDWKIEKENASCNIKGEKLKQVDDTINISGVPSMYRTKDNFENGEFEIKIMNSLKGNLANPQKIGTFFNKKININDSKKEKMYEEFEDYCNKYLYFKEKYF